LPTLTLMLAMESTDAAPTTERVGLGVAFTERGGTYTQVLE
jgi:hypothetical protein